MLENEKKKNNIKRIYRASVSFKFQTIYAHLTTQRFSLFFFSFFSSTKKEYTRQPKPTMHLQNSWKDRMKNLKRECIRYSFKYVASDAIEQTIKQNTDQKYRSLDNKQHPFNKKKKCVQVLPTPKAYSNPMNEFHPKKKDCIVIRWTTGIVII